MEQKNVEGDPSSGPAMYRELGTLTRQLHDALSEMGHMSALQQTAEALPGTRSRLTHIAELTGSAAEKSLNAVDAARGEQDRLIEAVSKMLDDLEGRTPNVMATAKARETLHALREAGERTNGLLTEIMMAQDFHDLTTQIIRRVIEVAAEVEERLIKLLVDAAPSEQRQQAVDGGLLGPMKAGSHVEVVSGQAQVDDLLASLGF